MAAGIWHISEISWCPAELLMFIRTLSPFDTQRSYRARKSVVADALETAVAAGGGGLDDVPFQTTSAQEGELDTVTGLYCGTSCCRCGGDPAGMAAPTTLPVSVSRGGRSHEGPG
jgi:hypothetical protein